MQMVFDEIKAAKKEMKGIREQYRDALAQTDKYAEVVEKITVLREEKKGIEARVQALMGKTYEKLEQLKIEVAGKEELLNDIAMTTLMKGETVAVTDEYHNKYEPIYVVRFKKTNEIRKEA